MERSALLPLAGFVLLAVGVAFEFSGQLLHRFAPVLAAAVAAVIVWRLMRRFRR